MHKEGCGDADIPSNEVLPLARWMAPESIGKRHHFSTASDVWSFGVLQWELRNPNKEPYHVSQTIYSPTNSKIQNLMGYFPHLRHNN